MRADSLPSTGRYFGNGYQLRRGLADAISALEVYAKTAGTTPAGLAPLVALLAGATTATNAVLTVPRSIAATATDVALSLTTDTSEQIVVTVTKVDNSTANVAATSTYLSSNVAVATVNATGLVTAVGVGSCTIAVQYQSKTSSVAFTVGA